MSPNDERLLEILSILYHPETAERVNRVLLEKMNHFSRQFPALSDTAHARPITQADSMLITYGDQVSEAERLPLQTLGEFLRAQVSGWVSNVHILPFYPYTSDDGFSVVDYLRVNELLGSWVDVQGLSGSFGLMFDAVINHISRESAWFQGYLAGEPRYAQYFIEVDPGVDLSQVFRPRTLPLLTEVQVGGERRQVWTTFSEDQIDLNFANSQVLLEIIDVLLFYAAHGARFIRLDAIGFLWKEPGTRCLHLPQTHAVVKLIRAIFERISPGTRLITETNVPHEENIAYFGDGRDEAQFVYNFALPPLVLHSFCTGDAQKLSTWAAGLAFPSNQVTFFNFLASHDGIGVTPARGILSEAEIEALIALVRRHGGLVSARTLPDGSQIAYELNINFFDALSDPKSAEPLGTQVDRFVAAHAIMFSLAGMPGIYFHSLFGSRSWQEGAEQTGQKRTINRQKLVRSDLEAELADPTSLRAGVCARLRALLQARSAHPAFSPYAAQRVLRLNPAVFCLVRGDPAVGQVLCAHNVSGETQILSPSSMAGLGGRRWRNLITGAAFRFELDPIQLPAYGVLWMGLQ